LNAIGRNLRFKITMKRNLRIHFWVQILANRTLQFRIRRRSSRPHAQSRRN